MKNWVVYITFYSGNILPPFYIGVSYNIYERNYKGSVKSKKYFDLWNLEIENNPHLFKTKIIKCFGENKKEAYDYEHNILQKLKVSSNSLYINMHNGAKDFGSQDMIGEKHHNYKNDKHKFINLNGNVVIHTQYEICKKYGLHQSSVSQLINGKIKSVNGWYLHSGNDNELDIIKEKSKWRVGVNAPSYKDNKYKFFDVCGNVIEETAFNMIRKYKCKDIYMVIAGKRKSSNNFYLMDLNMNLHENIKNVLNYDKGKKYKWIHTDGTKDYGSCAYMSSKYKIDKSHLSKILNKKMTKTKGWGLDENI